VQINPVHNSNPLALPQAAAVSSSSWRAHAQFEFEFKKVQLAATQNSVVNGAIAALTNSTAQQQRI
jgi:hypothetical protein